MNYWTETFLAHQDSQSITLHLCYAFLRSGIGMAQILGMSYDGCLIIMIE
jgi:hypothetical protein